MAMSFEVIEFNLVMLPPRCAESLKIPPEINPPIGTTDCRSASLNSGPAPMTRAPPLPKVRSHHEPRNKDSTRAAIADALASIGEPPVEAVAGLVNALTATQDDQTRRSVTRALAAIGPSAAAVPALSEALVLTQNDGTGAAYALGCGCAERGSGHEQ